MLVGTGVVLEMLDPGPVGARLTLSSSEVSGAIGGGLFLAMIFVVMFTLFMVTRE